MKVFNEMIDDSKNVSVIFNQLILPENFQEAVINLNVW